MEVMRLVLPTGVERIPSYGSLRYEGEKVGAWEGASSGGSGGTLNVTVTDDPRVGTTIRWKRGLSSQRASAFFHLEMSDSGCSADCHSLCHLLWNFSMQANASFRCSSLKDAWKAANFG